MHPPIALPLWLALLTLLVLPAAPACAADGTNASRPLFFTELIALDTDKHRSLTLPAERKSYAFASRANLLPVTVAEAGLALRHYPLVFLPEGEQLGLAYTQLFSMASLPNLLAIPGGSSASPTSPPRIRIAQTNGGTVEEKAGVTP